MYQSIYRTDWGALPGNQTAAVAHNDWIQHSGSTSNSGGVNQVLSEEMYTNDYYNKYETYIVKNRQSFINDYFKLPNLINQFIRGGEENIGSYYEDTIKNHKHHSNGHNHNFTMKQDLDHYHTNAATFHGESNPGHMHTVAMQAIDVSFDKLIDGVSETSPQNIGQL